MKYAFVIDDDPKIYEEVKEALAEVDPQLNVRHYVSLEAFVQWIRTVVEKGKPKPAQSAPATPAQQTPEASAPPATAEATAAETPVASAPTEASSSGAAPNATPNATSAPSATATAPATESKEEENVELRLIVIKSEFLKHKGFDLLKKTREYFIQRGICTKEDPTAYIVTAFEADHFDYSKYENQVVSNIIFKPFDKLILRAHLRVAMAGSKIEKGGDLYVQKTSKLNIELLKEAPMISLNETGFVTSSDRELPLGAITKYYGKIFQSGKFSSVYAKLSKQVKTSDKVWHCHFVFFNIQPAQSSIVRRAVKADKKFKSVTLSSKQKPAGFRPHNFVFLSPKDTPNLEEPLRAGFQNVQTTVYNEYLNFLYEVDPLESLAGGGGKTKEKPMYAPQVKVFLDQKFSKVLGFEPAPTDTAVFLGQTAKALVEKDPPFLNKIYNDDKVRWLDLIKNQMPPGKKPEVFRFRVGDDKLVFLKVTKLAPFKHPKFGDILEFDVAEISDSEKKDFLSTLSQMPKQIDALFIDRIFLGETPNERWTPILNLMKERAGPNGIKVFVLTGQELRSEDILERKAPIDDIFNRPYDTPSAIRRVVFDFPALFPKEDIEISSHDMNDILKVAQAVPAVQVSESGLVIKYTRALPVGQFRTVVLWMPHEIGLPEFLVSCYGVEEVEENKEKFWLCHFIFFGVRDMSLKHVRRWLKEYYVTHKDAEG
jgi:hypothetical protein